MGSDYYGGLLNPLAKLFHVAIYCSDTDHALILIDQWNKEIAYINQVLSRWRGPENCKGENDGPIQKDD